MREPLSTRIYPVGFAQTVRDSLEVSRLNPPLNLKPPDCARLTRQQSVAYQASYWLSAMSCSIVSR